MWGKKKKKCLQVPTIRTADSNTEYSLIQNLMPELKHTQLSKRAKKKKRKDLLYFHISDLIYLLLFLLMR